MQETKMEIDNNLIVHLCDFFYSITSLTLKIMIWLGLKLCIFGTTVNVKGREGRFIFLKQLIVGRLSIASWLVPKSKI